jgi:hypothetical protein
MMPSVALDLKFDQPFAYSVRPSANDLPLFLAADGVHGVVNVHYGTAPLAADGTDIIKLCLYGTCNEVLWTGGLA